MGRDKCRDLGDFRAILTSGALCVISVDMKTVTTREAQHHLAKVMELVEMGGEVVITRRGKKVAKLVPFVDDEEQPVKVPEFGTWRKGNGIERCGGENAIVGLREED